ncbi:MAG: hypothetical protein K6A90_07570 [Lachnospiraceae bacterium]|nr:hypothetical protein [Lachnospiraceae bacterium]
MEKIILENDLLSIAVVPELGGKISSLFCKNRSFEAAARPGKGKAYLKPEADGRFTDYDMSGIDDAFPNIDAETISYEGRVLCYPDHGEIWSREMEVLERDRDSLTMKLFSGRFRYDYEKTVSLDRDEVTLHYDIVSRNDAPIPCFWTLHGLLTYKDNMEFTFPGEGRTFINVLDDTPLGENGRIYDAKRDVINFKRLPIKSLARYSGKPYYMKYYLADSVSEGSCGVYYPSEKVRVTYTYDKMTLPWLGVWINGGGFEGDYNVALEMTNGYYDSVGRALENKRIIFLKPGEKISFDICIRIEQI